MADSPLLAAEELQRIRARLESDDFDYLDVAALFDHIDAITDSYEAMVTRTAEHNNRSQAVLSELEIKNAKQEAVLDIVLLTLDAGGADIGRFFNTVTAIANGRAEKSIWHPQREKMRDYRRALVLAADDYHARTQGAVSGAGAIAP